VRTLGKAVELAQAGPGRVLACAETFVEDGVTIPAGVSLFGGLNCTGDWSWIGGFERTGLQAISVGLAIRGSGNTSIHDLDVQATAAAAEGATAIGVLVETADVEVRRSDVTALAGVAGTDATPFTASATDGVMGHAANACYCDGNAPMTPIGSVNPGCTMSTGGVGGAGIQPPSSQGASSPSGTPGGPTGMGGSGGFGLVWLIDGCKNGGLGQSGDLGDPGGGATGLGTIDANGWTGVDGSVGTAGSLGGGGGGGGGDVVPGPGASEPCAASCGGDPPFGPSGAGGGTGGCGGAPGGAGGSGGASMGVVSYQADVTLEDVTVTAADGGAGGAGAAGQAGGSGGSPGQVRNDGCAGGAGGDGGDGGPGGGGIGGHSVAIAYVGTAPVQGTAVTLVHGQAGAGGAAGDGSTGAVQGADGIAADVQEF